MKTLVLAAAVALAPLAAVAEEAAVLVSYGTSSGSLPPEYAWDNEVIIYEDGKLVITHCKGYATEPPGCKTRKGKVSEEAMQAIRDAAIASDLAANPAKPAPDPMVGGGGSWGKVMVDGQTYEILWDPRAEDANRTGDLVRAIDAAIPDKFARFMYPE